MRSLARTSIYVLILVALCSYGTYRVYVHPGQVRARLEAELERFVTRDVVAEGCELDLFGPIRAREIVFPAAPLLAERELLTLADVELEAAPGRRPFRFRRVSSAAAAPPTIHVSRGVLRLDHEVLSAAPQAVDRWSFSDLLRTQAILDTLERTTVQVLLDRLEVQIQDLRPPRGKLALSFAARDVEARWSRAADVTVGAELDECELWSGGYVEMKWSPGLGFQGRGHVDEVKKLELLSPLLGWAGEAWEVLRPSGVLGVDVERFSWGRDGTIDLQATVEHYDTSFTLETSGLEVRGLRGSMLVNEEGWRIGQEARGVGHAEVLGSAVEVSGSWSDAQCQLDLTLAASPLENVLPALVSVRRGVWSWMVEMLQPRGSIEGRFEFLHTKGRQQEVSGTIGFRDMHWQGFPILESARGKLIFPFPQLRERAPTSRAKIDIDEARCAGIGAAVGTVQVAWSDDGARVDFLDLKFGANDAAGTAGSVFASLEWGRDGAIKALDLRGLDLYVETPLLEATEVGGSVRRVVADTATPDRVAEGSFELGAGRTRAGVLWPESPEIRWREGKGMLTLEGGARRRIVVGSFRIGGETHALRAQGDLGLSGALDIVLLVADGPGKEALEKLSDQSPPARWKEAAQGHFRAFRASGTVSHPRLREIGALDPAFVEAAPQEPRPPPGD